MDEQIINRKQCHTHTDINIRDIELMKVRENIAGTLLLAFKTEEQAHQARDILRAENFEVMER